MKQRFQRGDSDVFDLAWLDDEELKGTIEGRICRTMKEAEDHGLQLANDRVDRRGTEV